MQIPKKHFPTVGLLALVLVAATGGSIYYYQFVLPHNPACGVAPVHRVIFLNAIIHEQGGFTVTGVATTNRTLPVAQNSTSNQLNFTDAGLHWSNSSINGNTILANVGDNVTVYMFATNASSPQWPPSPTRGLGHGFGIDGYDIRQVLLTTWGTWGSTTFTVTAAQSYLYRCEHDCSPEHFQMTGSLVVGACG